MRWTALIALAVAVTAWPAAGQGNDRFELEIGEDTTFHTTEPTASLSASEGLRFCMFLDCLEDGPLQTEVSCPGGTDAETSPEGRKGCCSDAGFELKDYNCPGGDDSLLIFLRLDKPLVDACVDYSVSYFL